ncbi:FMN-dependent NADH-azoreductase [Vibrio sp. YIC-376]|uniref:FMN-dependent NADH-azoreductase n=1 Tax=Vibrio sp. YIC-376 TaxID=3136162 RepID=UPI00402AEFA3
MNILHIDSSILGGYSVSRTLSADIVERQQTLNPGSEVTYRDLVEDAALHLSDSHLAVFQGSEPESPSLGQDIALGSTYINEVFAADIIVIGAPMYNLSIPSQLKGWIDRVLVAGQTFRYGENGPEGLLPKEKKVFIASTRGGIYSEGSTGTALEHQESYLKSALAFIGLTDVSIIRAEGLAMGEDIKANAISIAKDQISAISA